MTISPAGDKGNICIGSMRCLFLCFFFYQKGMQDYEWLKTLSTPDQVDTITICLQKSSYKVDELC